MRVWHGSPRASCLAFRATRVSVLVMYRLRNMAFDRGMSVLVVDDHETSIRTVRTLLRQLGFVDVDAANNFAEALGKM
jgi:PleD family two-component response regulator